MSEAGGVVCIMCPDAAAGLFKMKQLLDTELAFSYDDYVG